MISKTTIAAVISAGASFVLFAVPLHLITVPNWVTAVALFAQVGGLAGLGIVAKDYNVTGGTVGATPEAKQRVNDSKDNPPNV